MIYDERTGELFDDNGELLKTVWCPYALRPENLLAIHGNVNDRECQQCEKVIRRIDQMDDGQVRTLLAEDPSACVFATPAASHVRFLRRTPHVPEDTGNLKVIRSVRNLPAMEAAHEQGFKLLIRAIGEPRKVGPAKYRVTQHEETGAIQYSGDYRGGGVDFLSMASPEELTEEGYAAFQREQAKWKQIGGWHWVRTDLPFPLGAYLIPQDLAEDEKVFVEDVLEDIFDVYWNQGNANRRNQAIAIWKGGDLIFAPPETRPSIVG